MSTITITDIVANSDVSSSVMNGLFLEIENFLNGTTPSADLIITRAFTSKYCKNETDGSVPGAEGSYTAGINNETAFLYDGTNPVLYASSSLTNTIQNFSLTHVTSGTPNAGIGAGLEFKVKTSTSNNKVGLVLEAVTTDVTEGSENFDFVVKLMNDGALASEVFRVASNGDLTFTGDVTGLTSLTVDNLVINGNDISSTSGNLTFTPATGDAVIIDGTVSIDSGVITGVSSLTVDNLVIDGNRINATSGGITLATGGSERINISSSGKVSVKTDFDITLSKNNGYIATIINESSTGKGLLIKAGEDFNLEEVLNITDKDDNKILSALSNGTSNFFGNIQLIKRGNTPGLGNMGGYDWLQENSAGIVKRFGRIRATLNDDTSGSEDASIKFYTMENGTEVLGATLNGNNFTLNGSLSNGTITINDGDITGLTSLTVDNLGINGNDINATSGDITFSTGGIERMSVTDSGEVLVSNEFDVIYSRDNGHAVQIKNTSETGGRGLLVRSGTSTTQQEVLGVRDKDDNRILSARSNKEVRFYGNLEINREGTTPGIGAMPNIDWLQENSAGSLTRFARITGNVEDATNGSEDASIKFYNRVNGSETLGATLSGINLILNGYLETETVQNTSGDLELLSNSNTILRVSSSIESRRDGGSFFRVFDTETTPSGGQNIGGLDILQQNSNGDYKRFTRTMGRSGSVTAGNESGAYDIYTLSSGTEVLVASFFSSNLNPGSDNSMDLGSSARRWDNVWATNGTIQTSDKNKKTDIRESDLGLDFINKLKPVSFRMKDTLKKLDAIEEDGTLTTNPLSNELQTQLTPPQDIVVPGQRKHYGLLAQDIEELLEKEGIDTNEFAPFIKDGEGFKGLRYTEFIGIIIKAIKELKNEIDSLKQ